MELIVDNQIIKCLTGHNSALLAKQPWLHPDNQITFRWPSLLEYVGFGSLFSTLATFEQNHKLFEACVSSLCAHEDKDAICHIYDQMFVEHLNQIKNLPEMDPGVFLKAIQEQRKKPDFLYIEKWISSTLSAYERAFLEHPSSTMHDLILYLAWDRMCVWVGYLFNHQSTDPRFINALTILKECLMESFQHINAQGRTTLGIYRMLETFFFYHMREENIDKHTDEEWALLSRSFPVLKQPHDLADFFYIDDGAITQPSNPLYLTFEPLDQVNSRLSLAHYLMGKLREEGTEWDYVLQPKTIQPIEG